MHRFTCSQVAFEESLKKTLGASFEQHIFAPIVKDLLEAGNFDLDEDTQFDAFEFRVPAGPGEEGKFTFIKCATFQKLAIAVFGKTYSKGIKNYQMAFEDKNILKIDKEYKLDWLIEGFQRSVAKVKKETLAAIKDEDKEHVYGQLFGDEAPWNKTENGGVCLARKWRATSEAENKSVENNAVSEEDGFRYTLLVQCDFHMPEWQHAIDKARRAVKGQVKEKKKERLKKDAAKQGCCGGGSNIYGRTMGFWDSIVGPKPKPEILDFLAFTHEGYEGDYYSYYYLFHLPRYSAFLPVFQGFAALMFFAVTIGIDYYVYVTDPNSYCASDAFEKIGLLDLDCFEYKGFTETMWAVENDAINCSRVEDYNFTNIVCFTEYDVTIGNMQVGASVAYSFYLFLGSVFTKIGLAPNYDGHGSLFVGLVYFVRLATLATCIIGFTAVAGFNSWGENISVMTWFQIIFVVLLLLCVWEKRYTIVHIISMEFLYETTRSTRELHVLDAFDKEGGLDREEARDSFQSRLTEPQLKALEYQLDLCNRKTGKKYGKSHKQNEKGCCGDAAPKSLNCASMASIQRQFYDKTGTLFTFLFGRKIGQDFNTYFFKFWNIHKHFGLAIDKWDATSTHERLVDKQKQSEFYLGIIDIFFGPRGLYSTKNSPWCPCNPYEKKDTNHPHYECYKQTDTRLRDTQKQVGCMKTSLGLLVPKKFGFIKKNDAMKAKKKVRESQNQ